MGHNSYPSRMYIILDQFPGCNNRLEGSRLHPTAQLAASWSIRVWPLYAEPMGVLVSCLVREQLRHGSRRLILVVFGGNQTCLNVLARDNRLDPEPPLQRRTPLPTVTPNRCREPLQRLIMQVRCNLSVFQNQYTLLTQNVIIHLFASLNYER